MNAGTPEAGTPNDVYVIMDRSSRGFALRDASIMIELYNADTDQPLGSISEADLQALADALEEESVDDQDYYIDADTIDLLVGRASPALVDVLRSALGTEEGIEIRWQRRE